MKLNKRVLLVAGLIVCLGAVAILAQTEGPAQSQEPASPRQRFQLPKLFDFARFKGLFKKTYKSIAEELVRQKLFLARAFRSFISSFKYKHNLKSYYLRVNHLSDWTPEEVDRMRMHLNGKREGKPNTGPVPMASEEEIEAELRRLQEHANEPGYKEMAETLGVPHGKLTRRRRGASVVSARRELTMDDLMGVPNTMDESPEVKAKMQLMAPSNNPDYEAPERMSFGGEAPVDEDPSLSEEEIKKLESADALRKAGDNFRQVNNNDGPVTDNGLTFGGMFFKIKDYISSPAPADPATKPDQVFVDHRESGCFFKPRNQGGCGSCYSFAWTSMLEYLHCKDTGKLVPISEQYMIDCGYRYDENNSGCDGAPVYYVAKFIEEYGWELRLNYPYTKRQDRCPYSLDTPAKKMGYMKTQTKVAAWGVKQKDVENVLKHSPLVVQIGTEGSDFHEYGGGVHDMNGCKAEVLDHAVLLVGHGREDGKEYWLIRNSYGVAFGEVGYYKLDKSVNCLFDNVFSFADKRLNFGLKSTPNKLNDNTVVKDYYMKNLMEGSLGV